MATTIHPTTITADVLRDAIEARDADTLAGLYDRDATVEIVDADHPPGEAPEWRRCRRRAPARRLRA